MNVLITGASGLVATQFIVELLQKTDYKLILLSTSLDKIKRRYGAYDGRISYFTIESLAGAIGDLQVDVCVHTDFARSSEGSRLVSSVEYTIQLLTLLKKTTVRRIVNISSQGVYGKNQDGMCKETYPLNPDYMYALGKYSTEVVFRLMLENTDIQYTNIRLSSVCENARFLNVFVRNALAGNEIHLTAGSQICSFIDVRDVASALLALINKEEVLLEPYYNLGTGITYSIREIAELVKIVGDKDYGTQVVITEEPNDTVMKIGMDNSKFVHTFGWSPNYTLEDMIISLFEMNGHPDRGGYPIAFKIVYQL